jgi:hypothetical protein
MAEDLLRRIQREMDERLEELRGAVDEHDRLQADLSALQDIPEPSVDSEPPADPGLPVDPEPLLASELPVLSESRPANVMRFAARRPLARTRMVSPKVARLMHAPRRPALERSGVVRVGAAGLDSPADEPVDEIDTEAELFEHSL